MAETIQKPKKNGHHILLPFKIRISKHSVRAPTVIDVPKNRSIITLLHYLKNYYTGDLNTELVQYSDGRKRLNGEWSGI